MEKRQLEITILSAKDLKDVSHFFKMDVYVVVTISGEPSTEKKTPVDRDGGTSPKWNHTMKFIVDEAAAKSNLLNLIFQLRSDRILRDNKHIGEVHVPIKELLNNAGDGNYGITVTYPVRKPSGKAKGKLKFSYRFGAVFKVDPNAGKCSTFPPSLSGVVYPPVGRGSQPPRHQPPISSYSGNGYIYHPPPELRKYLTGFIKLITGLI